MTTPRPIVIIGVGNDYRTDDGAGLQVARLLRELHLPNVRAIDGVADGTDLINAWQGADAVFVIDSVISGTGPGTIHRFDGLVDNIREDIFPGYSTHAFSIPKTINLARAIDQLPKTLIIYGIEADSVSSGSGLSPLVSSGVDEVVRRIKTEVEWRRQTTEMK